MPELEKSILGSLADNRVLFDTLQDYLLAEFETVDGEAEGDRSDVQLGQAYRARMVGVQTVKGAFKKIEKLKSIEERDPRVATHR